MMDKKLHEALYQDASRYIIAPFSEIEALSITYACAVGVFDYYFRGSFQGDIYNPFDLSFITAFVAYGIFITLFAYRKIIFPESIKYIVAMMTSLLFTA